MALPSNHRFRDTTSGANCTSIGGTPVAVYIRVPYRGAITKVGCVAQGAITTADATMAFALNGSANTAGNFTLPVAGAAAGQIATAIPTAQIYVQEDDVVTFTPSGASGTTIPAHFFIVVRDTQ